MLHRMFVEHPESVGETYAEHMLMAGGFGLSMLVGGIACMIHALVPGMFVKTGSETVSRLYDVMIQHRRRKRAAGVTSADALEWVI